MKTIYLSPWQPFIWGLHDTKQSYRRITLGEPMVDCGGWHAKFTGIGCFWIEETAIYDPLYPLITSYRGSIRGKSAKNTMKRIDNIYINVVQRVEPTSEPYMLVALDAIKFNSLSIIA